MAFGSFCRPGLLGNLHQGAVACFAAVHSDIHPPTQAQALTRSRPAVTPWQLGAMSNIAPLTTVRQSSCLKAVVPAPARPPSRAPQVVHIGDQSRCSGCGRCASSAPALRAWIARAVYQLMRQNNLSCARTPDHALKRHSVRIAPLWISCGAFLGGGVTAEFTLRRWQAPENGVSQ